MGEKAGQKGRNRHNLVSIWQGHMKRDRWKEDTKTNKEKRDLEMTRDNEAGVRNRKKRLNGRNVH